MMNIEEIKQELAELTKEHDALNSLRCFDRFLSYFGFIKIEEVGKKWKPDKFIAKTDLFDKLIKVQPHNPINVRPN